jgi:hypothetical protein
VAQGSGSRGNEALGMGDEFSSRCLSGVNLRITADHQDETNLVKLCLSTPRDILPENDGAPCGIQPRIYVAPAPT